MERKPIIVYLGAFRFPDQGAAAKRVLGIGYMLRDLGYRVVFAGGETGETSLRKYEGFEYYSQNELDGPACGFFDKLKKFLKSGYRTSRWLNEFLKSHKVDKVIIYNSSAIYISKIKRICNTNNVELIADITEWYDSDHLPGGKFGPVGIDNWLKMNFIYKAIPKHIVISTYLEHHYNTSVSIVIPPLLTEDKDETTITRDGNKKIVYVGSPGKKDNLELMVETFSSNSNKLLNLDLIIAGISEKEYIALYDKPLALKDRITFLGRIDNEQVKDLYGKASFSFFLRPNERYANAGFPTKFVESISYGVPVITNATSDIEKYLINGENGFLLNNLDHSELGKLLEKANNLSQEQVIQMKKNSITLAEKFYYKRFTRIAAKFLS